MSKNQIISLFFKGIELGRIGYDEHQRKSFFQYHTEFLDSGKYTHLFPYIIKRVKNVQVFSEYEGTTFRGLPPMIADSLPDMFGNIVFKEWLEMSNKEFLKISPLEQLTYVANRGMGALEYVPARQFPSDSTINLSEITEVVSKVMDLKISVEEKGLTEMALFNIFKIGTSAGGARPKVLISEHKESGVLIPGDIETSDEYTHYLIKLHLDQETDFHSELIEYIYYTIATVAGIEMMPSKLIDHKHFATERFDRQNGVKQHVLTASGMTGWDFEKSEQSSYENLFKLALDLRINHSEIQQLFRRMVFNIVFAITDDHLKNFSFIYNENNDKWELAPAYDLTYSLNPLLRYTRVSRAMSVNGKRMNITREDVLYIAELFTIKNPNGIIEEVVQATHEFSSLAQTFSVSEKIIKSIEDDFNQL